MSRVAARAPESAGARQDAPARYIQ